jgi:hypothetical protein
MKFLTENLKKIQLTKKRPQALPATPNEFHVDQKKMETYTMDDPLDPASRGAYW